MAAEHLHSRANDTKGKVELASNLRSQANGTQGRIERASKLHSRANDTKGKVERAAKIRSRANDTKVKGKEPVVVDHGDGDDPSAQFEIVGQNHTREFDDDFDDDDDDDSAEKRDLKIVGGPTLEPLRYEAEVMREAKEAWKQNLQEQREVGADLSSIRDDKGFNLMVDLKVQGMVNETARPEVAGFLGDMRKESRKYAKPGYELSLERHEARLERREKKLHQAYKRAAADYDKAAEELHAKKHGETPDTAGKPIAKLAANVTGAEEDEDADEDDEDENDEGEVAGAANKTTAKANATAAEELPNATAAEKPQRLPATGATAPKFTAETMPKMSPTLLCIISLLWQYFVVFTVLAVLRFVNMLSGDRFANMQGVVELAVATVAIAPICCCLFLGTRMRAIQLTKGDTEKYGLPMPWQQHCMFVTVNAIFIQVVVSVLVPILSGEPAMPGSNIEQQTLRKKVGKGAAFTLLTFRWVALALLIACTAALSAGAFLMEAPRALWAGGQPPVSPAVQCTMVLCVTYMFVFAGTGICRSIIEIYDILNRHDSCQAFVFKLASLFTVAAYVVALAPMMSILFIGARMRALQIDPVHGNPQPWAQGCFYLCTCAVVFQVLLVVFIPLVDRNCQVKLGPSEGEVIFEFQHPTLKLVGVVLRWSAVICLYVGICLVIVSVFTIYDEKKPEATPPVSSAVGWTLVLTLLYFLCFTMLFVAQTLNEVRRGLGFAVEVFEAATKEVLNVPMLCVLFIGVRMRALQLCIAADGSVPEGAGPQPWAQQAIAAASWCVVLLVLLALARPLVMESKTEQDGTEGGERISVPRDMHGHGRQVVIGKGILEGVIRLLMFVFAAAIIAAAFMMTPETLPPYAVGQAEAVSLLQVPSALAFLRPGRTQY